jgi:signal transduction histidine kinase
MPDMRGDAVIRRVRLDPSLRMTPCLLLTASEDGDAEIQALDAGADAFARKHLEIELVLARFAAMLRAARDLRPTATSLGATRVLAVDDTADFLLGIAEVLRTDGHDVVTASSGEEAIELIAVQPVDCVVLDLGMPGISGAEMCRRVKAAPSVRDIPLVVLSGNDNSMAEAFAAGADDFLLKPADAEVVRARVKAHIRRKRIGDEQRAIRERLLRSERQAAEAQAAREIAEARAAMAEQLEAANRELAATNRELEAFSYSVSHDLRAPLRAIRSFAQMVDEDAGARLDEDSRGHLRRVIAASVRMTELVEGLLELARISRVPVARDPVDISAMAYTVAGELQTREPVRKVDLRISPGMRAHGDVRLLRAVFDNLLGNAWKFSASRDPALIQVGRETDGAFFVRDNGIGFDMAHAERLFVPFQRLHSSEVPGTGIGLATVRRIVERHGGTIWAESEVGRGTTIYFRLP